MDISLFDMVDNGISNDEIVKVILSKLQEKYKNEFIVKRIGNRYGNGANDSVTTYCCPKDDEDLVFSAILDKSQTLFIDDYKLRQMSFQLEKDIKDKFKENNVEVLVKTEVIGKNKLEEFLSVQEFIDKYKTTSFLTYIIINGVISDEVVAKVYEYINNKYKKIYLKTFIYMIEEDFEKCNEMVKTVPSITNSMIERYKIKNKSIIRIFEGKIEKIK